MARSVVTVTFECIGLSDETFARIYWMITRSDDTFPLEIPTCINSSEVDLDSTVLLRSCHCKVHSVCLKTLLRAFPGKEIICLPSSPAAPAPESL